MQDDHAGDRPVDSTMAGQAYAAIKKRILDSRYIAGERISEAHLAKELGLGRSPIRTALAKLKSDGWIAISPQSGTYIKTLSDKEIADLLDLRLLLETHVAERAAQSIEEHDLRRLRRALVSFSPRDLSERAFDEFNEFDSLLHLTLCRAAGNGLITEILANLLDRVQWLKTSAQPSAARIRSGYAELRGIIEALEAREPKLAAARMREHIMNAAAFVARNRAKPPASADSEGHAAKSLRVRRSRRPRN